MNKPSILLINRVYPSERGATGRLLQDLARALDHSGWKVTILTTGAESQLEIDNNISVNRIKSTQNYKTSFGYAWGWFRLLGAAWKMPKHDVVLTLTDPPLLIVIGRIIARRQGAAHVHWCHDIYPDLFKPLGVRLPKFLSSFLSRVSLKSMSRCAQVVVIGRCMAQKLKKMGVPQDKISMIANWADFEVIAPSAGAGAKTNYKMLPVDVAGIAKKPKEMFRDDSPKFRVLYAGSIGRAHPIRPIIEAAAILAEHTEIEFVFIGDKHAHSMLARERDRRGLENIKFMPYQPIEKLREVMESGDVHLVTMRKEVKGLLVPCKFYSGLSVGRPTIFMGPKQTEIGRVIKDYNAGKVVSVGNAKELAKAIYEYRHNGDEWFQAQEGALRAAQAYHPNQSLHKWLEVLEQARVS